MILEQQIKNIYSKKKSFPLVAHNENMALLENKVLYWKDFNPNPRYALIELSQELNASLEEATPIIRNRVLRNLDNIIYFLDEATLDDIIKNKFSINDKEVRSILVETAKDLKYYNRIEKNIKNIDKKIPLTESLKHTKYLSNMSSSMAEDYLNHIVETVIETYPTVDIKQLYSMTNEAVLVKNITSRYLLSSSMIVNTIARAFVEHSNITKEQIQEVQEKNRIQSDNKYLMYLLSEDEKTTENKEGLKKTEKKNLKDMVASFELEDNKTVEKLKKFMNKIYEKPVKNITEETPFILGAIRKFFIIGGSFVINPILGIVAAFTDFMIDQEINRPAAEKHLKQLETEKNKAEKKLDTLKKEENIKNTQEYIKQLDKNISKVEDYIDSMKSDKEQNAEWDYEEATVTPIQQMAMVLAIEECFEEFKEETQISRYVTEGKIANTLKLAGENLKGKIKNLTGKEKVMSQKLDASMDKFSRDVEYSMSNQKREDIIKGRVLPSFSRTMKMGLAFTAVAVVSPLVAVVGALASIAVSKKTSMREKQYILDEIEVHLKIVDKKVQQAEMNGDDKTLEELYKLQLKLRRERQRIKHGMKVYYQNK